MSTPGQADIVAMEVATLRGLAEQAHLARRGEATLDVETLSARLRDVARLGGPPELGPVLLGLLESGNLANVKDLHGHACRALAVKALLALDVPEARRVPAEDLAFARGWQLPPLRWLVPVAATLTALGGILSLMLALVGPASVRVLLHEEPWPPMHNLLWALHGGVTAWRAFKLVSATRVDAENLRAMLFLAVTSLPLVLAELPLLLDGGPGVLLGPLFAGVPAALSALLLRAMGQKLKA
ncbi:hypothetical protein ACLESD_25220 [Pyxidicoccus sp. 3LFB2]